MVLDKTFTLLKGYKENNLWARPNLFWIVFKIKAVALSKIKKYTKIMLLRQSKFESLSFHPYFTVIKMME